MHFDLGKKRYAVRVWPETLKLDGETCDAKIEHIRQRILIAHDVPRHKRKSFLRHELRHAWVEANGRAADNEGDAVDVTAFADWFDEQYANQGGDAVLEALNPEESIQPRRFASGPQSQTTSTCGCCGALVAVGSIANDEPEWDRAAEAFTMTRGMLCAACDRVTTWTEICSEQGLPLGAIIAHPKPRVLAGAEAAAWIAAHPEACNVLVA